MTEKVQAQSEKLSPAAWKKIIELAVALAGLLFGEQEAVLELSKHLRASGKVGGGAEPEKAAVPGKKRGPKPGSKRKKKEEAAVAVNAQAPAQAAAAEAAATAAAPAPIKRGPGRPKKPAAAAVAEAGPLPADSPARAVEAVPDIPLADLGDIDNEALAAVNAALAAEV